MFRLIKKVLILVLVSVGFVLTNPACVLLKIQECKVRKVIVDNDYIIFPYKIKINKCIGRCNNITNPYSRVCFPDIVKNISVKVFNLISQQHETRQISLYESYLYPK